MSSQHTATPKPQDVLAYPLAYVTNIQQKAYRKKAIKTALIFICVGIAAFIIDLLLYSRGVDTGAGLAPAITAGDHRGNGLTLLWMALVFLSVPYGIYRLLTLRRYMARLASNELIAANPTLKRIDTRTRTAKEQALDVKIRASGVVITKIFAVCIALLVAVTIAAMVWAMTLRAA